MSLKDDVAKESADVRQVIQRGADRIVAARVELAAAIGDFNDAVDGLTGDDASLFAFIAGFRNPAVPNPPPIAPEVAAPPPAQEPPVFTTVDTADLTPETTSGGFAPVIADELNVPEPSAPAGEGGAAADGAAATTTDKAE